jgi:CheY-like chemotaxis protein
MSIQARILLVDDESAIIEILASFLECSGFEVKTANNGEEVPANIKIEAPELILSYVLTPKMDGRELLCSFLRGYNWLPVIQIKQVGDTFERVMALEEGVDRILTKPSYLRIGHSNPGLSTTGKTRKTTTLSSWQVMPGDLKFDSDFSSWSALERTVSGNSIRRAKGYPLSLNR